MRTSHVILALVVGLGEACGSGSAVAFDQDVRATTEVVEEGGASPFQGRLSFRSPEAMAAQDVPYADTPEGARKFEAALARYRNQWTFLLAVGPKPGKAVDPQRPLALDIENNGGMWGDRSRNLQRLMFEMGGFTFAQKAGGKEIPPVLMEFQRSFGMGLDRCFLVVFPKQGELGVLQPPFEVVVKEFGQGTGTMRFPVEKAPPEQSSRTARAMWKRHWKDARE